MVDHDTFEKVNLVKAHAILLSVSATVETSGTESMEGDAWTPEEFLSVVKYRRNSTPHLLIERTSQIGDGVTVLQVQVRTIDVPDSAVPRSLRREGEFLSRWEGIGGSGRLNVFSEWTFAPEHLSGTSEDLAFPLPFRIGEGFSGQLTPLDEIVGIRAVKYRDQESGEYQYSFILDRSDDGSLSLQLSYDIPSPFQPRTMGIALAEGERIAKSLGLS